LVDVSAEAELCWRDTDQLLSPSYHYRFFSAAAAAVVAATGA